ncbi:MAG: hypothetical protein HGN29_07530 [Asgard group archaeon]|nr:hypothetical protein [Asgard group archaeon]
MEEPPQEEFSSHEEDEEMNIIKLPATIADSDKGELFKELTTILSRKWIKEKTMVFGCSEMDLLLATRFDINTLRETLEEYKGFVEVLGLEVLEYEIKGERWYCLRSNFYAPSELEKGELAVLGTIIGLIEGKSKEPITTEKIKEKLVVTGKMKEYFVENTIRKLVRQGYIERKQNEWKYNYRVRIEFGEKERRKIAREFRKI